MWNFDCERAQCGIVFSDGTKVTQADPYQDRGWGVWWPCLFVPDASCPGQLVAYCQEQALSGGRAWPTHPSRMVRLRHATAALYGDWAVPAHTCFVGQSHVVETPGVVIEEIVEEEENLEADAWEIVEEGNITDTLCSFGSDRRS